MCPNSSVGSTLDIFPLILVDQRGREFKSTWRNNFFWPFFSVSNYIIFYIYVICMLYSTQIRSQKVWVVYVYYRFILEQCVSSFVSLQQWILKTSYAITPSKSYILSSPDTKYKKRKGGRALPIIQIGSLTLSKVLLLFDITENKAVVFLVLLS